MNNVRPALSLNNGAFFIVGDDVSLLAAVLASCSVYERDGWQSDSSLKLSEHLLSLELVKNERLASFDPAAQIKAAKKETQEKTDMWLAQYDKANKLEKELAALKAQLDGIKSVTTCTTKEDNPL
jgi:hypothetical protein